MTNSHTHYEARSNPHTMSHNHASALRSLQTARKVPDGYKLLYQNSTYSNTMKPCVYLCKDSKVWWNFNKVSNI